MNDRMNDIAKSIAHDVGEALLKRFGEFRGQAPEVVAEYYSLIRDKALAVLRAESVIVRT